MDFKITNKSNAIEFSLSADKNILVKGEPVCTLPVGTILEFIEAISPAKIYGGTWLRFGEGRVTVGYQEGDESFGTCGATDGEKEHTLTTEEMPRHRHAGETSGAAFVNALETGTPVYYLTDGYQDVATTFSGEDQPHNNMPPYIVVYRWVRTA